MPEFATPHKTCHTLLPCGHISRRADRVFDEEIGSAALIIWMLRTIAAECAAIHANRRASQAVPIPKPSPRHFIMASHPSHSCDLLMSRTATLQRIVTRFDQGVASGEFGSLAELGLRAQTLAILLLLDELCDETQYASVDYQDLFVGRLRTIEDVASLLFDSLGDANRQWLQCRTSKHDLRVSYHLAIRQAQRAITELGADPDLVHFLRAGSSRTDMPRMRYACHQLAEVFNITLMSESNPALLLGVAGREAKRLRPAKVDDDAAFYTEQK
jgi:hypothetical protein